MKKGCVFRRTRWKCNTCHKRLDKKADREACIASNHVIEECPSGFYWLKYRRNGIDYSESSGSDLKKTAEGILLKRLGDIADGKPITPQMGRLKFEEASDDLLTEYQVNGRKSHVSAEYRLRLHLLPVFAGRRMSDITTADVRKFIRKRQTALTVLVRKGLRRPASNGEINRELGLLKRMFSLAIQEGKLYHKPHIPMLPEAPPRSGFFEVEQFQSVLVHLPVEIQPVIEFAYITGWRITSEVLPLEWRLVDFNAGEVRLEAGTTKNGEGRVFPMTMGLRRILEAQMVEHHRLAATGAICRWVFPREGKRIASFRKAWKAACRAAGCPGRIPHDLRRTAVRNLVRAGIPERVAMKMTGHKTPSVFQRYNIVSGNDLKDAARRLDAIAGYRV